MQLQLHSKGKEAQVAVCKLATETSNSLKVHIQKKRLNIVIYKIRSLKALWSLSWFHLGNCWNFQVSVKATRKSDLPHCWKFHEGKKGAERCNKKILLTTLQSIMTHKSVNKKRLWKELLKRKQTGRISRTIAPSNSKGSYLSVVVSLKWCNLYY